MTDQPNVSMYPEPKIGEQLSIDDGITRKHYEWYGTMWMLLKTEPTSGWRDIHGEGAQTDE